jgi:hypothetical protein
VRGASSTASSCYSTTGGCLPPSCLQHLCECSLFLFTVSFTCLIDTSKSWWRTRCKGNVLATTTRLVRLWLSCKLNQESGTLKITYKGRGCICAHLCWSSCV